MKIAKYWIAGKWTIESQLGLTFHERNYRTCGHGVCNREGIWLGACSACPRHCMRGLYAETCQRNTLPACHRNAFREIPSMKQTGRNASRRIYILSFPHIQNTELAGILPPFSTDCADAAFSAPRNCLYLQRDWGIPSPRPEGR